MPALVGEIGSGRVGPGWNYASPLGRAVGVDAVSPVVDGDVMVPPAQRGEVLNVMSASLATGDNVVDLEPVAALASINGAAPVTIKDKTAYFGGNHPGGGTHNRGRTRTLINHYLN